MIPLFRSDFNSSVTFSRVVFPSDGEWWLRLLPTTVVHRSGRVPAPWHERRASFVGRDLVNQQVLPVQLIAIARAILVPSLSPTWLSSSAPPKKRALSAAASLLLVVWILEDGGWGRCSCPGGKADTFRLALARTRRERES